MHRNTAAVRHHQLWESAKVPGKRPRYSPRLGTAILEAEAEIDRPPSLAKFASWPCKRTFPVSTSEPPGATGGLRIRAYLRPDSPPDFRRVRGLIFEATRRALPAPSVPRTRRAGCSPVPSEVGGERAPATQATELEPWSGSAPPELVQSGRHVTYMISCESARSGVLSMRLTPIYGHISIASLLGATLIGMRRLQRVPLLMDSGAIRTFVVLGVGTGPDGDAA